MVLANPSYSLWSYLGKGSGGAPKLPALPTPASSSETGDSGGG